MENNQYDFKPISKPNQTPNIFLIIMGIVFSLGVLYFSKNKKNNLKNDTITQIINHKPENNKEMEITKNDSTSLVDEIKKLTFQNYNYSFTDQGSECIDYSIVLHRPVSDINSELNDFLNNFFDTKVIKYVEDYLTTLKDNCSYESAEEGSVFRTGGINTFDISTVIYRSNSDIILSIIIERLEIPSTGGNRGYFDFQVFNIDLFKKKYLNKNDLLSKSYYEYDINSIIYDFFTKNEAEYYSPSLLKSYEEESDYLYTVQNDTVKIILLTQGNYYYIPIEKYNN